MALLRRQLFGSSWQKSFLCAMERSNESKVRATMESAVSGLQSALTGVSTVLTQLQTGRRPAAEERAAGRETADRDSDDDF